MKSVLLVVLAFGVTVAASASELTDRIRTEAQRCADALLSGDYATLIALTHPRTVQEMGGTEAAITVVRESMAELKADGVTLESVAIGPPQEPVASGAIVGVMVPQTKILKTSTGRLRLVGYLLAISEDGGGRWTFIDTSTLNDHSLREYFPGLADVLKLPARPPPEKLPE